MRQGVSSTAKLPSKLPRHESALSKRVVYPRLVCVSCLETIMNDGVDAVLQRYQRALDLHGDICSLDPSHWHRPDTTEFSALFALLTPLAESGEMHCQCALATIHYFGFCCESEQEYILNHEQTAQVATRWWLAAAAQGHFYALDNLITCGVGVGAEADEVREAARRFEEQRPELVGQLHNMPVYGPDFMQELCKTIYGRVATGEN